MSETAVTKKRKPREDKHMSECEVDAQMDNDIIDILKTYKEGLSIHKIQTLFQREKPSLYHNGHNYRYKIGTRLRYLKAFGEKTGLFEITTDIEDEKDNKRTAELYKYISKVQKSDCKIMLALLRTVKGFRTDKNDNARKIFSKLTKGENINFLDNEYPPDLYNKRMNINIRTIDSAISNEKMLNVVYGDYHINKSLVPRIDDKYTVYPIKMILSMGRLYLYCRHEHHDNLSCMRVDRIISCTECEKGFNRAKEETRLLVSRVSEPHFAQRLYMFTGKAQKITFLTDEKHLNDVFDWFGKSVELKETDEGKISVTVKADKNAMIFWAMQYCRYVTVTDPPEVADEIRQTMEKALERYSHN